MKSARAGLACIVVIAAGVLTSCEPGHPQQFQVIRNLGFEKRLGSFVGVSSEPLGTHRRNNGYLDWRTDGCSAGGAYWEGYFRRACVRHDFNWKNLYELDYYIVGHMDTYWSLGNRRAADDQFGSDMSAICGGGFQCSIEAFVFKAGVMAVPKSRICYDHYNWDRGAVKVAEHPNSSCT